MRSLRRRFEICCRVAAFGLLGWLLGSSVIPSTPPSLERASATDIASRLSAWTRAPANTAFHETLLTDLCPEERTELDRLLGKIGTRLTRMLRDEQG